MRGLCYRTGAITINIIFSTPVLNLALSSQSVCQAFNTTGLISLSNACLHTLGTRGFFSRATGSFVSSAAGRHVFGRRPKTRAAKQSALIYLARSCLVPRRLSRCACKGRREGDCTLPMVPCGVSPVTRFALASARAKNEAPEEEAVARSALTLSLICQSKRRSRGSLLRLDRNRKPRMKSLWHPGYCLHGVAGYSETS